MRTVLLLCMMAAAAAARMVTLGDRIYNLDHIAYFEQSMGMIKIWYQPSGKQELWGHVFQAFESKEELQRAWSALTDSCESGV